MKITRKQLRRLIREAMPPGGVPDVLGAMGGGKFQPREVPEEEAHWEDQEYERGYADGLDGYGLAHDASPAYEAGWEDGKLDSTLEEGVMTAQKMMYGGLDVEVDGEYVSIGTMIVDLLDAGDTDIFQAPQGVDERSLDNLMSAKAEGRGGPMVGWDSSIFGDYYNVDLSRVTRLYARLHGHQLEELEMKSDEW